MRLYNLMIFPHHLSVIMFNFLIDTCNHIITFIYHLQVIMLNYTQQQIEYEPPRSNSDARSLRSDLAPNLSHIRAAVYVKCPGGISHPFTSFSRGLSHFAPIQPLTFTIPFSNSLKPNPSRAFRTNLAPQFIEGQNQC